MKNKNLIIKYSMLSSLSTFNKNNSRLFAPTVNPNWNQFTYTISGSNFVGTAGSYPIQFNNTGTTTQGNITNFNIANHQGTGKQTTIYIKAKTNNNVQNARWLTISKDFTTLSDFMNIVQPNGSLMQSFNCCLFQGSGTNLDFSTTNILPAVNQYAHVFFTLNGSTGKQQWFIYSQAGNLIYTSTQANYTPSTLFNNVVNATYARDKFSTTRYNITIGNGGWFNTCLTSQEMADTVALNT